MHSLLALLPLVLAVPQNPTLTPGQAGGAGQDLGIPLFEEGDMYILSFDETGDGVDLESLTKLCQQATGINFTYDQATTAALQAKKVKIFGVKRIPKTEFYSFYQIIMFINQFVCTKVGAEPLSVVVIQELPGGRAPTNTNLQSEAIYVLPEELEAYSTQVATPIMTVLHLPHTDVRQLGNSLRALTADQGASQGVIPVGNTNSVILRGFASNVASLARILLLVDRESANERGIVPVFEVIPLEYAAAQDIADVIEQLLEASRRVQERGRTQVQAQGATGQLQTGGGESKIMVDPRTNSLLIMALPDDMQNVKELVARLDVEVVEPERNYHVYSLENVTATDLAEVLEDFIQDASRLEAQSGQARPAGAQGQTASSRESQVVVVPDPATNSLLIAASKSRYEEVLDLIRRLDKRQDQVLIETALIELSADDELDIGVELGFARDPSGTGSNEPFGVTSFGLSSIDLTNPGAPVRIPAAATGITAGIISADDFQLPVLIAAAKSRDDTNILNIPSVLVNNNGSATVSSVTEEPTAELQTAGINAQPITSFSGYVDAGITLTISPSISAAGYMRLNVYLEVSTFGPQSDPDLPPPKLTRIIETAVSVPDGDTMVIGGIITDDSTKSRAGVPWLGDIPIVGALFRRDQTSRDRVTLYFFVTPHILLDKDFADLAEISYQKKLEAAERIGADRIKMVDPVFGTEGDQVDLEGFDVPLYRSPPVGEVEPTDVGLDPTRRAELLGTGNQPPADAGSSEKPTNPDGR